MARKPHYGLGRGESFPAPEATLGSGQVSPAPIGQSPSPSTTPAAPHMGTSAPVTVTAPAKGFTGVNQHLISPPPSPLPRGNAGRGKVPGYNPGGPGLTYDTANSQYQSKQNVYRQSLTGPGGVNVPIGSTGQTPAAQLAHPGALQGIAESGSIQDIQNAQNITGAPVPGLTSDVAAAVNTMPPPAPKAPKSSLAPKKRGR